MRDQPSPKIFRLLLPVGVSLLMAIATIFPAGGEDSSNCQEEADAHWQKQSEDIRARLIAHVIRSNPHVMALASILAAWREVVGAGCVFLNPQDQS